MKTRIYLLIHVLAFLVLAPGLLMAQWVQAPGEPQSKAILLKGGTIHIGNGEVLENGDLLFAEGLIKEVGQGIAEGEGMEVIDISGKHLYPGLILPDSRIGLSEISAFRATSDYSEEGEYLPNLNTAYAYTVDSEIIPTLRYNGVLLAEATPSGGVISGVSSVMELDGWTWQSALVKTGGMHLNWPRKKVRRYDRDSGQITLEDNKSYDKTVSDIQSIFKDAITYSEREEKVTNLKLEAMQPVLNNEIKLFIHARDAYAIKASVQYFKSIGIEEIAVVTDEEALKVKDFLLEEDIPLVIPPTLSIAGGDDMDYDMRFKLPALLTKAGLTVALSHAGSLTETRNLPFFAGVAVAYGLSKEEALKLVTSNTAKILGIEDQLGTLEVGKHATLVVSEGDILDIASNQIVDAYIQGKKTTLENKQQEMYEKYRKKYSSEDE